ncbi:MAG: polymorphic toxin-type HINT domain-containing protein [Planctomycetaceae bacterium]
MLSRPESCDPTQFAARSRRVLNLFETHPIELYHLTIVTADGRRERLGTTGNHPFYEASERRFVPARELRPGCRVVTVTGVIAEVEAVEIHTAAAGESFTTYNIEVEEDHTYHVGELGTWVHNLTKEECLALVKRVADGDETAILPLRKGLAEKPELRELVPEEWLRRVDASGVEWVRPKGWRLPKNGTWEGTPGHSIFKTSNPAELGLKPGDVIPFREGRPDFSQWSKGDFTSKKALTGDHLMDEPKMVEALAEAKGWTCAATRKWLRENEFVLHHAGGDTFQLLDGKLHGATAWGSNGVRHMGGAFDLRNH